MSSSIRLSRGSTRIDMEHGWRYEPGAGNALGTLTLHNRPSLGYLQTEFPSECWKFPEVTTTVTHSLEQFFLGLLSPDPRIEHVYWFSENASLKVWTVIPEPDFSLEGPLYQAQMLFIEKTGYECDFSVIYRFGKSMDDIKPQGSRQVL